MANDLNTPTLTELVNRIQTDVQTEIPETKPFLPQSWLLAVIISLAGRFDENYTQLQTLFNNLFLDTATEDFIERWGSIFGIARLAATPSTGDVVGTGTLAVTVPQGTILNASNSLSYEVQADVDILDVSVTVTLELSGVVVTVIPTSGSATFDFATGQTVTISGATPTDYNGDFVIIMIDDTSFTYTLSSAPTGDIVGTILASSDMVIMNVTASTGGSDTNQTSGASLTFASTIAGVDTTAFVQLDGLTGGTDEESDDDYRARVLSRVQNPVSNYGVSQIDALAREVNGVTRTFIFPTTPNLGDVTVLFVRDNDGTGTDIIPDAGEITTVTDQLLTILPASMQPAQLIVTAPIAVLVDFTFQSLTPNTSTMQTAIIANLQQFFTENAGVNDDILEISYNSVIFNTIDPNTGEQVSAFLLSAPVGNVSITNTEIGVLNDVNF